jgi:hypothetical protein
MAKIKQIINAQPEEKGFLEKASDFLGTTALGKRIGGQIYSGTQDYKQLQEAQQRGLDVERQLNEQIQKNKLIGRDTSRLEAALIDLKKSNVQTNQAVQGLPTGGVTGKQVLGSALQTASWVPMTGALVKGGQALAGAAKAGSAGQAVSNVVKSGVKMGAIEGGISGALGGAGMELQGNEDATLGSTLGAGAGGATLGGLGGAAVSKFAPMVGAKLGQTFARMGSTKEIKLAADAVSDLTRAMPPGGKRTAGSFLKDYTGAESSNRFSALQAMFERNKGKTIKTIEGLDKEFDPQDVSLDDLPFMFRQTQDDLAEEMLDRLYKVSQTGVEVDNSFAVKNLRKLYNDAQKKDVKKLYLNYLNEVKNIKDPIAVRTYLQEIGAKVGPYMTTGTNPLEGKIASQVYKDLETSLNNLFAREQAPIKELYDQFSAMKRIEFDITKALSKQLREAGNVTAGNLVDDYGLSLIGSGLMYGSPMQMVKGSLLITLKGLTKMAKDPNRAVQSAFKKVDDWYKLKGVDSVIPPVAEKGIVPVGDVNPLNRMEMPGPRPKITDEPGVPMGITQQQALAPKGLPESSGQPLGYKSSEAIPVAPTGSAIDITKKQGVGDFTPLPPQVEEAIQKLPPEQQEAAKQWYQQGLDLFGEKKNLEGGFSKLGAVAGVGGTSGIIALINVLFGNKDVKELESKEVSATETPIEKPNLREAFVNAENRGARDRGEDLYKVKGVTGDLGKYQVQPKTLALWSEPWLGKKYTSEEFLNDPKAQEEFMNQFEAVVEAYDLTPEEAAIIWHKGWGVLGDQKPREEKKKLLKEHIERQKQDKGVMEYVAEFKKML